jgi:chemotaxis protein methyltransferase CheR
MISEQDFKKLTDVIYRRAGIAIDMSRYPTLKTKLELYMTQHNIPSFRQYFHSIRFDTTNKNMQTLMNMITINETYFYREKYQFEILVNEVLYELDKIRPTRETFRILCAPSSTGEEPFSIVLHLLEEGRLVKRRDIEIVGIDIDTTVIQKAKSGKFHKRSIDYLPTHVRDKYFKGDGYFYDIAPHLKDVVDFRVINVMDSNKLKLLGKFDIIFSRNMLIYFDDSSRKEVATTFYEMLNPSGFVFLGHAESMNRITSRFKPKKYDKNIIYQK